MAGLIPDSKNLEYHVWRYSGYEAPHLPQNITEDCPKNQGSRWSSDGSNSSHFLTLKLTRPSIVEAIKFGKYEKPHDGNLRSFKIYGGLDEDHMVLMLEGGLDNDSIPETIMLSYITDTKDIFPILYLKIVPLHSYGSEFNYSIWYVELHGQDDPLYLAERLKNHNMKREDGIIKMCLKHFREQGYDDAFRSLQNETNVRLEHPILTQLYCYLVNEGNFTKAESLVDSCINEGFMDDYLMKQYYKHSWNLQEARSFERPGTRGGHQLVIDVERRLIFLYGGWNGNADLSDMWCFNINTLEWSILCEYSEMFGGPTPRSCYKMVYDPITRCIFMLGRYLDNSIRRTEYTKSDFFLYDTEKNVWIELSDDTSQVGGPHLLYEHQMCIDVDKRTIYVFGGKILTPRSVNQILVSYSASEYSGLFSYHIPTCTWTQLLVDCDHPLASKIGLSIKSRVAHCMVFHDKNRKLYIYGGQRKKEEMNDFITYNVDTRSIDVLCIDKTNTVMRKGNSNHNTNNGCNNDNCYEPPAGFNQRAAIDCDRDEIYFFSSLSKKKNKRDSQKFDSSNSLWVFSLQTNRWSQIYSFKHAANNGTANSQAGVEVAREGGEVGATVTAAAVAAAAVHYRTTLQSEPCPRYAHQMVYDNLRKVHYLFGGNPAKISLPKIRLDDFWVLHLNKPVREEISLKCKYLIRKLKYEELTKIDKTLAIKYLRNHVSAAIDHNDSEQVDKFHKLTFLLFQYHFDEDYENDEDKGMANEDDDCSVAATVVSDNTVNDIPNTTTSTINSSSQTTTPSTSTGTTGPSFSFGEQKKSLKMLPLYDKLVYKIYRQAGGKKSYDKYNSSVKYHRMRLFNQIAEFMPSDMVQPTGNLSDYVLS